MTRSFIVFALFLLTACKTTTDGGVSASSVMSDKADGANKALVNPETTILTAPFPKAPAGDLSLCSYNISFLGAWPQKQNKDLASLLVNCDVVVIQELSYPNADKANGGSDPTADFFNEMAAVGLDKSIVSPEKTGPTNQNLGRNSDFFVAFYNSKRVTEAKDLPSGWIDQPLVKNPRFDRVPYAFGFRAVKGSGGKKPVDFVMISVHLHPTEGKTKAERVADKAFRVYEFGRIQDWIKSQNSSEGDYLILGDTNIEDEQEYTAIVGNPDADVQAEMEKRQANFGGDTPSKGLDTTYTSLNAVVGDGGTILMGGTNLKMVKPYDHVFYNTETSTEIRRGMNLIDTVAYFRPNGFLKTGDKVGTITLEKDEAAINFTGFYSDHDPVQFFMQNAGDDD